MAAQVGLGVIASVVALLAAVTAGAAWRLPPRAIAPATAGLALLAGVAALALLVAGSRSSLFGGALAIDPLGAFFLLLPALAGIAAACGSLGQNAPPALPGFIAAALLTVLAGDAATALLGAALFVLAASDGLPRGAALAGLFVLAGTFALLAQGAGADFSAMRGHPPEGLRAASILVLTLLGVAPVFGWSPGTLPGLPVAALSPGIGLYVAVRILADLCGPATPTWWSLPLLLAGAGFAVLGVAGALRAATFGGVLDGLALQHGGWMLAGLGVAVAARAADVLPLATLALGGAMLHALNHTVVASLAAQSAQAASAGAGSDVLDRLGGLAVPMKLVALGMLTAGLSLALLPPSAGFASGWMLLQAAFAAPRVGGWSLQLVAAAVVCAFAMSAGFGAVAVVRMGGVTFLGRPRTPRGAAAEDARPARRATILGLIVTCGVMGAFPGLALRLAAEAQRGLTGTGLDGQGDWAGLRTQWDLPGYAPFGIVLLLGLGAAGVALLARGKLPGPQSAPGWEDGYAAPPPWMPFGDPATQLNAEALALTLPQRRIGLAMWPRIHLRAEAHWPHWHGQRAPLVILVLAVLLLLAAAGLVPG